MTTSHDDPEAGLPPEVQEWLARLGAELPPGTLDQIASPALRAAILDLARVAAHRSARMAAPLSTYLAASAYASLPEGERIGRIRDLLARLDDP